MNQTRHGPKLIPTMPRGVQDRHRKLFDFTELYKIVIQLPTGVRTRTPPVDYEGGIVKHCPTADHEKAQITLLPGLDKRSLKVFYNSFRQVPTRNEQVGMIGLDGVFYANKYASKLAAVERRGIWHGLLALGTDLEAALKKFGDETVHCGICGRPLTDPESKERGIGPVCAERWAKATGRQVGSATLDDFDL